MSNIGFVGKEGFNWWIGQIPPEPYHTQINDKHSWGIRHRVRILGYHPEDKNELGDDQLPTALVMLPTTAGSLSLIHI